MIQAPRGARRGAAAGFVLFLSLTLLLFARRVARDTEQWRRKVTHVLRQHAPAVGATLADGGAAVEDLDQLLGPRRRCELAAFFLAAWRATR